MLNDSFADGHRYKIKFYFLLMLSENPCTLIGTNHSDAAIFLLFFVFVHIPLNKVMFQCYIRKEKAHEKMNMALYF